MAGEGRGRRGGRAAHDREKLESLRRLAAPYLQNAVLHRKLTDLAAIDDLTLVLNRRFGLRCLHEEFSRAVRPACR